MVDLLTNDSKDAQYVGSKDDQEVDENEQNESNGDVARPVERLIRKRHLLDRSPYLKKKKFTVSHCFYEIWQKHNLCPLMNKQ